MFLHIIPLHFFLFFTASLKNHLSCERKIFISKNLHKKSINSINNNNNTKNNETLTLMSENYFWITHKAKTTKMRVGPQQEQEIRRTRNSLNTSSSQGQDNNEYDNERGINFSNNQIQQQEENDNEDELLLPDNEIPRPSYYTLQILGLWQPKNSNMVLNIYHHVLVPVLWIFCVVGIFGRCFLDYQKFRWGRLLNATASVLALCAPYLLAHIYFQFGSYNRVLSHLLMSEDRGMFYAIKKLSRMYSLVSIVLWGLSLVFYICHFRSSFLNLFYTSCYVVILVFCTGWWATWLAFYGFMCSIHKKKIQGFAYTMKERYGYSSRCVEAEEKCIQSLIEDFTHIKNSIAKTQKDFEKIVSFVVTCVILDAILYSVAYWKHEYREFPMWQYIAGIAVDFVSIMFKLYPAAIVNQTIHTIVQVSGEHCYPDIETGETPKQRFIFYQFLFLREQDLGMYILGVRITSKLTVGVFVTIATVALTFLHFVVPFLNSLSL